VRNAPDNPAPRVSIGLPVYNGERFLRHTIESFLGQSFTDFELIISDNASTDLTAEICLEFARKDPRVRYFRQSRNRGATFNWNFVVHQARGEFFKWAAANDHCDARFVERCLEVLRQHHDVVLCYCRAQITSDEDEFVRIDDHDAPALDATAAARFIRLMSKGGTLNESSGLVRLEALRQTRLQRRYPQGDNVLMAELAALGKFWLIDDALFYRRIGSASSMTRSVSHAQLQEIHHPERKYFRSFDKCIQQLDFLRASLVAPVSWTQKPRFFLSVLRRIAWQRDAMAREVVNFIMGSRETSKRAG
jgi:glycosyltransferase involved in cell wall biosynthesis